MSDPQVPLKSFKPRVVRDSSGDTSEEELTYHNEVRQKIEAGVSDIRAGKVYQHMDIKKKFGILG